MQYVNVAITPERAITQQLAVDEYRARNGVV